jgi:peptidoglycan-associated lipoprotein
MKFPSSVLLKSICLSATLVLFAGCAAKKPAAEAPSESTVAGAGAGDVVEATPDMVAEEADANRSIVYFEFDSSTIRAEFTGELKRIATELAADPRRVARLEGHTDSRGSREYNVGLGERRAQAARQFLLMNGVAQAQLSTISYGEERPAAAGDEESAWSQNRRVEIVRTTP